MVTKLLEYVYLIIKVSIMMLCHWYVLKKTILFNDIFIGLIDINLSNKHCVLQLHRSHA